MFWHLAACNTCRDVTVACYFHAEKIFTVPVKIKACEDITLIFGENPVFHFTAENVIKVEYDPYKSHW